MSSDELRRTHPLGVFRDHKGIGLIGREKYSTTNRLVFGHGEGPNFHLRRDNPSIVLPLGRTESPAHIQALKLSQVLDRSIMAYTVNHSDQPELRIAVREPGEEMDIWDVPSINRHLTGTGMVVPEYMHDGQYLLYYGHSDIRLAFSRNLVAWHDGGKPLAAARRDRFDHRGLNLVTVENIERGLFLLYETRETHRGVTTVSIGAMLCSPERPDHVIWRADEPLHTHTAKETAGLKVLGAVVREHDIALYYTSSAEKLALFNLKHPFPPRPRHWHATQLHRSGRNPILTPTALEWESEAVFNPAAFTDNGRVHLLYRAMGPDGVSRLGYASSEDGIHFDERLDYPVYTPRQGFGAPTKEAMHGPKTYDIIANPSGGGWAGCEDPRAVKVDGRVYLSYVAFDGWNFVRQALTSIDLPDVRAKNWHWRNPVLISKPGEIQKNWVIFPEKINGKYAILHGLSPKIHIEYLDSLDDLDGSTFIESLPQAHGSGYAGRHDKWDSRVRGAGAPPLKTPLGWLLLYHATDKFDPGKYKLGAMILDEHDPTKVLYRSDSPVLEPKEWYENQGKPGVVYTCGAVIMGENLIVYYGGGDKHIAVARTNVEKFIQALAEGQKAQLETVSQVKHTHRTHTHPRHKSAKR